MRCRQSGFTLIELMIVVVIIGILAAMAIPNFIAMQVRAKEGATKANMHTFQLSAEDYGIQHDAIYATVASDVATLLPTGGASFRNPFTQAVGVGAAWEDRSSALGAPAAVPGITSYSDSAAGISYNIKGSGQSSALLLVLSSGE